MGTGSGYLSYDTASDRGSRRRGRFGQFVDVDILRALLGSPRTVASELVKQKGNVVSNGNRTTRNGNGKS